MKLDQIAFYAHNEEQVEQIKRMLGLQDKEWVEDIAEGNVTVFGLAGRSKAHLRFNYDLGIEVEILTYLEGPHWHMQKPEFIGGHQFLSHIGFHMAPGEAPPHDISAARLVQVMDTDSHTNPYLLANPRTYHYEIYATATTPIFTPFPPMPTSMGADLKFIWRVEPE